MRLVVTGGGTGGHVYPALEVAKLASERGASIQYLGSLRGQESRACEAAGFPFFGFPSEPLYSIKSLRGLKALLKLQHSRLLVKKVLRAGRPDAVFSTGGYSGGPVAAAARDLLIPYMLHSVDSCPARSLSMFAKGASAFSSVFRSTSSFLPHNNITRTGQPIRSSLRAAAVVERDSSDTVLVVGGSQGSAFLNEVTPPAVAILAGRMPSLRIIHVVGPKNYASMATVAGPRYEVHPYLNASEMAAAYAESNVVVARSGGTLAEIAMFGLPSVLIPLPNSANDHQLHNAEEFVGMRAAIAIPQAIVTAESLADSIWAWITDGAKREVARRELIAWDVPDATSRIVSIIESIAGSKA